MPDRQEPVSKQEPQTTLPPVDGDTNVRFFAEISLDKAETIIINAYVDNETEKLDETYDPTSYRGYYLSDYGEHFKEEQLSPLVGLGEVLGCYVGVDRKDMPKVFEWANQHPLGMPEDLTDIRVAKFGETEVCFPTPTLLESFHVRRRVETQE